MPQRSFDDGIGPGMEAVVMNPGYQSDFVPPPNWRTLGNMKYSFTHYLQSPGWLPGFEWCTTSAKGPRSLWKPFSHYTVRRVSDPRPQELRVETDAWTNHPYMHSGTVRLPGWGFRVGPFGDAGRLNTGLPSYLVAASDGEFVPPPANLNQLIGMGLNSILPVIKSEISLVNSIIELKDFSSITKWIPALVRKLRAASLVSFKQNLKATKRTLRNAVRIGTLSRTGSGSYLQAQFNVLPLLSDIAAIKAAMLSADRQIADFLTHAGRLQKRHFAYNWQEEKPSTEEGFYQYFEYGRVHKQWRYVLPESAKFHVELQYNYNYTALQAAHARLLAFFDVLGLNFNPSIIWNAIPWSFVIDWVVGVGRFLDQFTIQNMRPTINIQQALWSISRRRNIRCELKFASTDIGFLIHADTVNMPVVLETAYRRQPFVPGMSLLTASGLTAKELSLGAALVISRRRRSKR